ncbi:MAG: flagellar assembly protein FliW [Lachnospiraceae bacterium]|nr:flagellar assembly protein FliW [Lachnospiraceae bacterium]
MSIKTKLFGEIEIEKEKVITFEKGIIGFPELKKFALIYDSEKKNSNIQWIQSLDDGAVAFPVMDPICVVDEYNPVVSDELMEQLGEYDRNKDLAVAVILRVPSDIKDMSVNLKAPVIINTRNNKAIQLIVESDLPVRFPIYDILQAKKEAAEKEA